MSTPSSRRIKEVGEGSTHNRSRDCPVFINWELPANSTKLIQSLRTHRVNTLTELCRIEKIAANSSLAVQERFQEPMTSAWTYYVDYHQFLTELRGMTRNYPFSSDLLEDVKWRVRNDPDSDRSWNFAWLCLVKIKEDDLISAYAEIEAARPDMWGGREPTSEEAAQLASCFAWEWNSAVERMLGHWDTPPTATGY